jgi:transcriptional regulatory protein RtcR
MKRKKTVVIGLLGVALDGGKEAERWERWRPTVALCQHEDLLVDRLELLYQRKSKALAAIITQDIASVSPETTVVQREVEFDDPWDFESVYAALHDYAREYQFDPEQEDYLVHITTGTHVAQICLFLLTESRRLPARLLQTSPPKRRTDGGPGDYEMIDLDLSRYDRLASRFAREQREAVSHLKGGIATRNARFNELIARIEQVALASREPLLLMGPTGAGKSHLARRIYELRRARRAVSGGFVEINCATIRGDGAMSALFGHVKGAFTGALQARAGLLKAADGGALFLDEIGELGLDEQAMLLRALEEKTFFPLGGDREVRSDFQLIAGTNRDLGVEVARGRFREDLFARINLWTFRLPSLAERREDIEPNLDYELDAYARRTGAHNAFNREARVRFLAFAVSPAARWLANFRDLNAAVVRMATLAPGGRISVEIVEEEIARLTESWRAAEIETQSDHLTELLGRDAVAEIDLFDRLQLENVLCVCRKAHTLSEAGRKLFQVSRQHKTTGNDADRLRKYLARFGLSWEQVQGTPAG